MSREIKNAKEPNSEEFNALIDPNNNKLILTTFQSKPVMLLIQNNRLVVMKSLEPSLVGTIVIGRVDKITPGKDSCFVRIDKKVSCFLPFSKEFQPFLTNREWDGKLKEGDQILVSVIRDGLKTKLPTVSADYQSFLDDTEELEPIRHKALYSVLKTADDSFQKIYETFILDSEYHEVITDQEEVYHSVGAFFESKGKKVRFYQDSSFSLSSLYSLKTKCEEAFGKRVWLKSGAYLVIEQTEACVVIDINSGKNIKKETPLEVNLAINLEAMQEIALQMRLRELSGMILVDCINMASREQEQLLLDTMRNAVANSPIPVKVHDITRLGIMEITRKKMGKSLQEQFPV